MFASTQLHFGGADGQDDVTSRSTTVSRIGAFFFILLKDKKGARSFWTVGLPLFRKTSGQSCQAPLAHYSFLPTSAFATGNTQLLAAHA